MADDFGLVVHSFHGTIADTQVEIVEDAFLMTAEHPSKIAHGLEPRMGGPPKPLLQEAPGPAFALILPELPEALLEKIGAIAAKIELL